MPVISYDFSLWIDAFEQFAGRLIIRVLRYKFAMNGVVEDFVFRLLNSCLQTILSIFNNINYRE